MPENDKAVVPEASGPAEMERPQLQISPLRCGDCLADLPPDASEQPPSLAATDSYCPRCVKAVATPRVCRSCGSVICPACGSPVEMADELGIG